MAFTTSGRNACADGLVAHLQRELALLRVLLADPDSLASCGRADQLTAAQGGEPRPGKDYHEMLHFHRIEYICVGGTERTF